jgi:hypothetical protein
MVVVAAMIVGGVLAIGPRRISAPCQESDGKDGEESGYQLHPENS